MQPLAAAGPTAALGAWAYLAVFAAAAAGIWVYQKWGRAAVFVTPSIVSGVLQMKFRQFVVWNFLAGTVFVVAVGSAAY